MNIEPIQMLHYFTRARTTRTQTISLLAFTSANSASLSKSCRNMCLCNRTGMPEENFSKLLPIEFGGSNASARMLQCLHGEIDARFSLPPNDDLCWRSIDEFIEDQGWSLCVCVWFVGLMDDEDVEGSEEEEDYG
eukprot:CCRYP_008090-RC/>CCRYP_008090-RC protein AED:0.48 eAED:1.00 QI:0/0/0/1/0/0/3/0/134